MQEKQGKIELNEKQYAIVEQYCGNNMKNLKQICNPIIMKIGGIGEKDYDDLYSLAQLLLYKCVGKYDENNEKKASFNTFFTNILKKRLGSTYIRDRNRYCRSNTMEDENGEKIFIPDVSLDTPSEEDYNLIEKIASDFNVEDKSEFDFNADERVEDFLNSLSNLQKNILLLRMKNISSEKIKEKLRLSDGKYFKEMKSIRMNEGLSVFTKNKNDGSYIMEVKEDMGDRIIEINESENYRMDKYNMYSLLEDKKNGDINCHYILQRKPFQWTPEEANRYFCRVLSNLPIPEIILCEQKKKGLTISHLIDGLQRLSYAAAFKENRIKIGKEGAERHLIQYRDYILDDSNNRILDEDGLPRYEIKVFDVIGKYYKDLPDELKRRFNNFNINVTKFFDCTDEQIADHIRDYNNHSAMNKEQSGFLNVSADVAGYIKQISQKNTFFKNCGKFTDNNKIKGKLERVVAESIMLLFFRDLWKSKLDAIYKFVDENATEQQFLKLNSQFNRLELAIGDNNKKLSETLFTPTTMPMWIAVFDKFTTYDIEDSRFVDFLNAYNTELKDKEIDGVSMADFKDQQTKKKTTITGKIDLLVKLMKEYLHITDESEIKIEATYNKEETHSEVSENITETENNIKSSDNKVTNDNESEQNTGCDDEILSFVKENVADDIEDIDIKEYQDFVDVYLKIDNPLYIQCKAALIALTAYAYRTEKDIELATWLENYQKNINAIDKNYSSSQDVNYKYIKMDFDNYINFLNNMEKGGMASVN